MKLWVDDIRLPPENPKLSDWHWKKTSGQAIDFLWACKLQDLTLDLMSLDHDLGGDDTSRRIVLWCCEQEWWPVRTVVHSANPVGVEWLEGMITRYGR